MIVDNDFAGDPVDLFALAHQLLSESAEAQFVIDSWKDLLGRMERTCATIS